MEHRAEPLCKLQADGEQQAIAIMVHGTYAAAAEDSGDSWWQADSPCSRELQPHLGAWVRVAKEKEVFHWSGENSERARSKAGVKLLKYLRSLEDRNQDYHLVGHSHGGSVIWHALQMSMVANRPLRKLGSWTTVGTPFMQHRSRGALNILNLMGLFIGLILLVPAMAAPKFLVTTLYKIATDNRTAVIFEPDSSIGYATKLRTPVLSAIEVLGITVDRRLDGIQVGSFDPSGEQSLARYFFATSEGLLLLILLIALSYFFIHCTVLCISPAIESFRMRLEQRVQQRAFDEYRSRWLGIWSPDDEAINGLRATLEISVSFVSKMFPREVVYLSDTLALLSRPYFWLLAPLYNRFVHPAVDGKVRGIVMRAAQGNDRPTATLKSVMPFPAASANFSPPALPSLLNVRLLAFANRHAHELVPKLRGLLAQSSFASGLEVFSGQLSGKELVHTAYFEQQEVLKLIAANMLFDPTTRNFRQEIKSVPPWLRKWFIAFKQGLIQNSSELPTTDQGISTTKECVTPLQDAA